MTAVQERMIQIIKDQPEDSSPDEIIRELIFDALIERGLEDSQAGRTHTHEEVREMIESW